MTAQGRGSRSAGHRSSGQPCQCSPSVVDISSAIMPVMTRSQTRALAAMAQAPAQALAVPAPAGLSPPCLDRNKS